MNINQPFMHPTFKTKGIPTKGIEYAFERQLKAFTIPEDDLAKIRTIANKCTEMQETFYKNKSILPQIINFFGENIFAKGNRARTYFLNSILKNFSLSIKVPDSWTRDTYVFGISKKGEDDEILRFRVEKDGIGRVITTGVKFDNEAPQTIKELQKEPNNATILDNILNTIKDVYNYYFSLYYQKQEIHIEPDKLKEIISNMKTIKSICKQHVHSWGPESKLIFLRENPDIKYDTKKKMYIDKNNENYSYYFNTLDGENTKDFIKLVIYDSQNNSAQTFVIKPNGEICSPTNERDAYHNSFNDNNLVLTNDENIKKYDIENICNSINDFATRYSSYIENKHNCSLNKTKKQYTRRAKNVTQNIQLNHSDAEAIISNLGKLKDRLNAKTYIQQAHIRKGFYGDLTVNTHKKGIIYGKIPNTENYYSCSINSNEPTNKFIINVYDNNYNLSNSFIVDKNGKFYMMHDLKRRIFSENNLTLMSDEEIRTNNLEELCKDIKTTAENYLNYIDSNNINCLTIVQKSKDANDTKPAEKAPKKISAHQKAKPKTQPKTTVRPKRTIESDNAPKTITEIPTTNESGAWVNNTKLYEKITQIFNTDVNKRSDKIINVLGSNGKVIPAIFEYKTSDGKSTIRIMKTITNWGIEKTNYCIQVTNDDKTYYYRIDGESPTKIIECDEKGRIKIHNNKRIQHIPQEDYRKKYPFMAEHFPEYVKEISEL